MNDKSFVYEYAHKALRLGFGVFVFYLSSVYVNSGGMIRLNMTSFPQVAIVMLFGFFHALNFYNFKSAVRSDSELKGGAVNPAALVADLLGMFFIFSAFYNVVLMPYSGLGILEWIIISLVLFSDFFSEILGRRGKLSFIGQNPMMLLIFGIILCLVKFLVFYLFDSSNIYDVYVRGNPTLKMIITLFVAAVIALGVVLLLSQLKALLVNRSEGRKKAAQGVMAKIGSFFKSLGKFLKNAAMSLFSAHVVLIIGSVLILVGGIVVILVNRQIFNDLLAAVEPFLEKITTGENSVVPSTMYGMAQSVTLILVTGYQVVAYVVLQRSLDSQVTLKVSKSAKSMENIDEDKCQRLSDSVRQSLLQMDNSQKLFYLQGNRIQALLEDADAEEAVQE